MRHTALHRACEELSANDPLFRKFYMGLSEAYGYPMNTADGKDLRSDFTVIPDGRILCWNHAGPHTLVKIEEYTTKADCKKLIRKAIATVEKHRMMAHAVQEMIDQPELL
jgi:hypothetical protein